MKPTFLFLGAQKSGSTTFIKYIEAHPEIYCHNTEIHYFDKLKYNKNNHANYEIKFNTNHKVIGEKTPSYLPLEYVIDRIHEYNPNMKLIIFLREPIQRAYSQFNMISNSGTIIKSRKNDRASYEWFPETRGMNRNDAFTMTIKKHYQKKSHQFAKNNLPRLNVVKTGYYDEQIAYVYNKFSYNNVHIKISEENKEDPLNCYNEIFDFLGVKKLNFSDIEHITNARVAHYKKPLNLLNKKLLYEIYKPHNKKLYELLGREKINIWEEYYRTI